MIKLNINPKKHFELFIFGSALYADNPSDVDLAIIYDKSFISIPEAIQYRSEILNDLSKITDLKIDTILLSKEEEKEAEFLSNAKHKMI